MNKKALRFAFNQVLQAAGGLKCRDLHHPKKHLHGDDEVCKAEYHLARQISIIQEYMKEHEL